MTRRPIHAMRGAELAIYHPTPDFAPPMNILQVIPTLDTGGAERTTVEIAAALTRDGHGALVASEGGAMEGELREAGGELIRLPLSSKSPLTIWKNADRLAAEIVQRGVDIVHARSRAPAWSALRAARKAGVPFVTTYHGTYNARSPMKRWYNSVMARGDRVIANSNFIHDHIILEHGALAPITIIPRGVDTALFAPSDATAERGAALRRHWGVADSEFLFLLPARLTRWKGQTIAIRALGTLKARGEIVPHLVLAGADQGRKEYRKELETLAHDLGVGPSVIFAGHCGDMPAAFAACDVALNPSIEPEAFGRTAAEASAAARPVIVADHGGAREVVVDGKSGWRVTPGDADALADAMWEATQASPSARRRMGAAGRARIEAQFTTASLQSATLQVYRELLE